MGHRRGLSRFIFSIQMVQNEIICLSAGIKLGSLEQKAEMLTTRQPPPRPNIYECFGNTSLHLLGIAWLEGLHHFSRIYSMRWQISRNVVVHLKEIGNTENRTLTSWVGRTNAKQCRPRVYFHVNQG